MGYNNSRPDVIEHNYFRTSDHNVERSEAPDQGDSRSHRPRSDGRYSIIQNYRKPSGVLQMTLTHAIMRSVYIQVYVNPDSPGREGLRESEKQGGGVAGVWRL